MYVYSFYDYDIVDGAYNGRDGYYDPPTNKMYVNASAFASDEQMIETFFHEAGHAVGVNSGNVSEDVQLRQAIVSDTKDYITGHLDKHGEELTDAEKAHVLNAFLSGRSPESVIQSKWSGAYVVPNPPDHLTDREAEVYSKVVKSCYYELATGPYGNDTMAPDVLPGVTNNAITSGGGHPRNYNSSEKAGDSYWYFANGLMRDRVPQEAWAEHFSSLFTGDQYAIANNANLMSDSVNRMNEIAAVTARQYIQKVKSASGT